TGTTAGFGDGGCILVDGVAGFRVLQDAVNYAEPGTELDLSGCTDPLTGPVRIDHALTIRGGPGIRIVSDDDNGLVITGDDVVVQEVEISAVADSFNNEEATGVQLIDVSITAAAGWGVRASDAESLTLSGLSVTGADDGGVRISGGSATITGANLAGLSGYGIRARGGASVSVSNSLVSGISGTGGSSQDGIGIAVDDGTLTTSANRIEDVLAWGIYGADGALTLAGDEIRDATLGVYANDASLEATGLTVTDARWAGVYAYASAGPVVVQDTTVTGTPGVVDDVDPDLWGEQPYIGAGLFLVSPDVTVSHSSVTGYGGVGILASWSEGGTAVLDSVQLTDLGQFGAYVYGLDVTATNVTVERITALEEDPSQRCGYVDRDVGVVVVEGSLDWWGGSISDGEGYGISGVYSDVAVAEAAISDTTCAGIMVFGSAGTVVDSDFSGAGGDSFGASIVSYQATALDIRSNVFHDNGREVFDWSSEYVDDTTGTVTRYDYYTFAGTDIQQYFGGSATIDGNLFTGGTNGIEVYSDSTYGTSTAILTDNRFTDYQGATVYAGPGSTVQVDGLTVEGFGSYPVICYEADLSLADATIRSGGTLTERFEVYTDEVLTDEGFFSSYGPALYAQSCRLTADSLTIDHATAWGVYLYGGTAEIEGLDLSIVGSADDLDGLTLDGTDEDASLTLTGSSLDSVDRYALVGVAGGSSSASLAVSGTSIHGSGVAGVVLENSSSAPAEATFSRSSISSSGVVGLYALDFDVQLDSLNVSDSGSHGIQLDGGNAALKTVTSYDNAGYGMVCENDPVFSICDYTGVDNGYGGVYGCDPLCDGEGGKKGG
ncbi:MAG: hypothetical protein D6798_03790, partial [Deltaproteobacteria bacterium]